MPIELRDESMIVSPFWQAVRRRLVRLVPAEGPPLVLRPHEPADADGRRLGAVGQLRGARPRAGAAVPVPRPGGGEWDNPGDLTAARAEDIDARGRHADGSPRPRPT